MKNELDNEIMEKSTIKKMPRVERLENYDVYLSENVVIDDKNLSDKVDPHDQSINDMFSAANSPDLMIKDEKGAIMSGRNYREAATKIRAKFGNNTEYKDIIKALTQNSVAYTKITQLEAITDFFKLSGKEDLKNKLTETLSRNLEGIRRRHAEDFKYQPDTETHEYHKKHNIPLDETKELLKELGQAYGILGYKELKELMIGIDNLYKEAYNRRNEIE